MTPAYDLLALDLDGTLFGPDGRVSDANAAAVRRAQAAGLRVVVCTGRGFPESGAALEALRGAGDTFPLVVSGGAMIVEAPSGRTMHRWTIDATLVERIVDQIRRMQRTAVVLKDRELAGYDYLVVGHGPLEAPIEWWFRTMPVTVRHAESLAEDEHPGATVRVGFGARREEMRDLAEKMRARFDGELLLHDFPAVAARDDGLGAPTPAFHLMEAFERSVSKWTAIHRLALAWRIDPARVAAIGDEINDVAMLEGAGLGVAMGNAIPEVRAVAQRHTLGNDRDGVAHAIEEILAGRW